MQEVRTIKDPCTYFPISDYWNVLHIFSGFVDRYQPTQVKEEKENILEQKLCDEVERAEWGDIVEGDTGQEFENI